MCDAQYYACLLACLLDRMCNASEATCGFSEFQVQMLQMCASFGTIVSCWREWPIPLRIPSSAHFINQRLISVLCHGQGRHQEATLALIRPCRSPCRLDVLRQLMLLPAYLATVQENTRPRLCYFSTMPAQVEADVEAHVEACWCDLLCLVEGPCLGNGRGVCAMTVIYAGKSLDKLSNI